MKEFLFISALLNLWYAPTFWSAVLFAYAIVILKNGGTKNVL